MLQSAQMGRVMKILAQSLPCEVEIVVFYNFQQVSIFFRCIVNSARFLCSEAPEMLCGLRNFIQLSIKMGMNVFFVFNNIYDGMLRHSNQNSGSTQLTGAFGAERDYNGLNECCCVSKMAHKAGAEIIPLNIAQNLISQDPLFGRKKSKAKPKKNNNKK